ncbi:MAG: PPE family protein [Mycobacterium sp.]
MLDFALLPPEVISTAIYTGPGSGPMMASAAAWDALSGQLNSFALGYSSAISALQDEGWSGTSSEAMSAAASTYVAWVSQTAVQTQRVATQARSAAAAYESARAATVPPAVVTANRTQLTTLVTTNTLGQNTALIAAVEAAYAQMWSQDAAAMNGYATSASVATQLQPFQEPPQTTNATAATSQATASAQAIGSAAVSQTSSSVADQVTNSVSTFNTLSGPASFATSMSRTVTNAGSFFTALAKAVGGAAPKAAAALLPAASMTAAVQAGPSLVRSTALASMGKASPIGQLSVPKAWADAAPIAAATEEPQWLAEAELAEAGSWEGLPATSMMGAGPTAGMGAMAGASGRSTVSSMLRVGPRRFNMPRPSAGG